MKTTQARRIRLLRPGHAAQEAGVTTHTLANWADHGALTVVRTAGGQRRYDPSEIGELARRLAVAQQAAGGQDEPMPGQLTIEDGLAS